jgi:hypothetical protein
MFVLALPILASGTVINVPADQPTLQAGINAAVDFDTVLVAPGIYTGDGNRDIDFAGKKVYLKGGGKFGSDVGIECGGSVSEPHTAFWFHTGEDSSAVVDGFAISGAFRALEPPIAGFMGAIQVNSASPIIRNCTIWGNAHHGIASGQLANPRIEDCWIEHNLTGIQIGRDDMFGGGDAHILRTIVRQNDSCGIELLHYGTRDIEGCLVLGNGADGIRLMIDMPKPNNQSTPQATGTNVRRTIITGNGRYGAAGVWLGQNQITLECSNVYWNDVGNFQGVIGAAGDALGNISEDAYFCFSDTLMYDEYWIRDNSPCAASNNSCGVQIGPFPVKCTCCRGSVGNVNMSIAENPDLSDLSLFIAYMTTTPRPKLPCPAEANSNGIWPLDISDLSRLIAFLTGGGIIFPPCPVY